MRCRVSVPARILRRACTALRVEPKRIVELGVYRGRNALRLRRFFPNAELVLVDAWRTLPGARVKAKPTALHWKGIFARVCHAFAGDQRVRIIPMTTWEAAPFIDEASCDLIYIDADHRYEPVCRDIRQWWPKLRIGGIMAGHDWKRTPSGSGVVRATRHCFGKGGFVVRQLRVWLTVKETEELRGGVH
jgi:hypothetical protein